MILYSLIMPTFPKYLNNSKLKEFVPPSLDINWSSSPDIAIYLIKVNDLQGIITLGSNTRLTVSVVSIEKK